MPRRTNQLWWWLRRLLFATLVAVLPWGAFPFDTSVRHAMIYTIAPARVPSVSPSAIQSVWVCIDAGISRRARAVEVIVSTSPQGTGRVDAKSLRWSAPPMLSGTPVTAESAAAFVVGAGLRGDDALHRDVGTDLDMLIHRIADQGVAALTPEFPASAYGPTQLPTIAAASLPGAIALVPMMPSIGFGNTGGATAQLIVGVFCAVLAIVIVLTGLVHRRDPA